MAKVSISQAAKLAGVSRTTLYEHYINKGRISVEKDHQDRPQIDTTEILRVFGQLKPEVSADVQPTVCFEQQLAEANEAVLHEKIKGLQALLDAKCEELTRAVDDKNKLLSQLSATTRLLENKPVQPAAPAELTGWRRFFVRSPKPAESDVKPSNSSQS